jgi:alanine racemase
MDAKHSLGEPRVLISRAALIHNAKVIRRALGEGVRICAIIKADAYGHDARIVADTLCNFGSDPSARPAIDAVAVASIDEASLLPEDLGATIFIFRPVENVFIGRQRPKLETAIRNGWVLTVSSPAAADDIARVAIACEKRAEVQVMVDTGMTRCGVGLEGLNDLLHRIESRPSLRLAALGTHFASAERANDPFNAEQLARFRHATDDLTSAMPGRFLRHAANSAALFFAPDSHLDMVRPGLALYGIDPTCNPTLNRPLRPVLKWTAPLISVRTIPKGTGVGYGQSWIAPRECRIGLVPVGYADGYPRRFSGESIVLIAGRPVPVVGRVSMDMMTLDLGEVPAQVGDEVTLLDDDPLSPASVYKLAEWEETIPYEIFCRIGARIPRIAIDADIPSSRKPVSPAKQ